MSARRDKHRGPGGAEKWYWMVDFVFKHPGGRCERVRRRSPVNSRRGAEALEVAIRKEMLEAYSPRVEVPEVRSAPRLSKFADEFLENYATTNNKASEVHTKRVLLRQHLLPELGARRLDEIGVRDVEAYKAAKIKAKYHPKSVNNQLCVLRTLLRTAVEWKLIETAPVIKPLRVPKPDVRFLTLEETRRLVRACHPDWRAMVVVALNTGLRLGELLALRWKHVDLVLGQLVVCENDWRGVIGTPKGHKARVVPLNNAALAVLNGHCHRRGALVFSRPDGTRLTYQQCRRPLLRTCKAANVTPVQWHALRHTFASQMAMKGVPLKAIQDLLGHATIEMTMRYAHSTEAATRAAVFSLDDESHGNLMATKVEAS